MTFALVLAILQTQSAAFSFDGVSLASDFKTVAARFTHSTQRDGYVKLAREDIHDHIADVGVSGAGRNRRVRIGFETRPDGKRNDYPTCAAIEAKLVARYGQPHEIRNWQEEASPHADRIWRSQTEELTLLCFVQPTGTRLFAEAVQIAPR